MSAHSRIAVVGCGAVSAMHFAGLAAHRDRTTVVAAVDPSEERRTWVSESWGVTTSFATVNELLASNVEFDAAVVSTPSHVRLAAVQALAEAGKSILVEKPLADSMDEAFAIAALAERTGAVIGVDQNFRDHYAFGLARDVVRSGEIGNVYGIDQSELVYREVTGWRAQARRHALAVMGVHWFDGFRMLLPDDADWLVARTHQSSTMETSGETDAFIQIHFGPATVDYTQSFASRFERIETVVFGESGTLLLHYDTLDVATASGTRHYTNPYAGEGKPESAYRCLEHVLDAAETGTQPENSVFDNLKTLSLLMGAYQSAETGQPVSFEQGILR